MKRIRSRLVGQVGQRSVTYHNGSVTNIAQGLKANVSTLERLEISSGHPFHKLSDPRRKPKAPKPYLGKNNQKRLQAIGRYQKYQVRLFKWKLGRNIDVGGDFLVRKCVPAPALKQITDLRLFGPNDWTVTSGVYCTNSGLTGNNITISPSSNSMLDAYGTRCIAKCLPTNPLVDMGQFLVELRDLPRIFNPFEWVEKAKHFRSLAHHGSSEYLNVQFGWRPFIDDINSFFKVTDKFTRVIQQYDRDSGRHVRRNTKLFDTSSTVSSLISSNAAPFPTPSQLQLGGPLYKDVISKQRVWFKGSFTYYLPPIDGSVSSYYQRYAAYSQRLFGLRLNIDLLWKVTPWTWALDWMANSGSVIRNWEAFHNQGLVMHYGYVMEEKIESTRFRLSGFRLASNPISSLEDYTFQISRCRRKATPYGFGLNPGSFTPFQNGIIAALGINRLTRSV